MPPSLHNTSRPRVLLLLLCATALLGLVEVRADEPASTGQSTAYHSSYNKPQQNTATRLPAPIENMPAEEMTGFAEVRLADETPRQAAPLKALISDGPTFKEELQEPARLFDEQGGLDRGLHISDFRPEKPARLHSKNELRNGSSSRQVVGYAASPIATVGDGPVDRVNHLRPTTGQASSSATGFAQAAPEYGYASDQARQVSRQPQAGVSSRQPEPTPSRFAPQESRYVPTPLPASSAAVSTPLPPKGETNESAQNSSGMLGMMVTMGGALLLVVGLFLVFAWMMKRTSTRRTGGMLPKGVIEVLGHQTITGRHQVHLLRIGKRLLLVSVMPDSVETLTEITDPLEVDRIAGVCRQSDPGSSTGAFQSIMQQFSQDTKHTQEPVRPDPIPTVDQLRQRLGG